MLTFWHWLEVANNEIKSTADNTIAKQNNYICQILISPRAIAETKASIKCIHLPSCDEPDWTWLSEFSARFSSSWKKNFKTFNRLWAVHSCWNRNYFFASCFGYQNKYHKYLSHFHLDKKMIGYFWKKFYQLMTTGEKAIEKYNESNQMKKIWNLDQ